ncbi:SAM-dependent methyltransferase [Ruminococcaceae bacterium TF06-43]|nr:SAM-dependent methyltransferase [Ruminococcaceae bacterium TF06-43]
MSIVVSDLSERLDTLTKLVLAEPVARIGHSRVTVRPLTLRGKAFFQLEYQQGQKVAHRNVARGALLETFEQELDGLFRSVTLCTETETRQYVRKTNGAYKCTAKSGAARAYGRDEITILDFGCGKSYLTFVLYYYFAVKRGVRAKIIGYDLKEDVVEHCNEVAARYGYTDLHFVVADVTRDVLYDEHIDMLVTLHACDVATDYALHYAISRGVEHIFSVPCCQHEVNKTIQKGGDFDILLSHGLFQERFSALLTDAIRAAVLEDEGYDVDVIEFIDFAHSPKNLMLRCHRTGHRGTKKLTESRRLRDQYGFEQTLLSLVENERQ